MEKRYFIQPDIKFIREVRELGGESLKKCFQCSTCSVICSLSPLDYPYPRKEMLWAQWGLKDRLLSDPDIWLCHGCNDCSTYCPRGAKPGDVLSALRNYIIINLASPRFLAKALSQPRYLIVFLALPLVFLLASLAFLDKLNFPEGEVVFSRFIPIFTIEIAGVLLAIIVLSLFAIGLGRFWKGLQKYGSKYNPEEGLARSFISSLWEIIKHSRFRRCSTNRTRYYSHLMVFYGFLLLLLATTGRAIYAWSGQEGPLPLTDPFKIAGNLGGLLVLLGLTIVIYKALTKKEETGATTYFEWFLVLTLYLAVLSGFATEITRLLERSTWAYSIYIVHLAFAFTVLAYLPFSRLAHLAYRTLALIYAEKIGRKPEG